MRYLIINTKRIYSLTMFEVTRQGFCHGAGVRRPSYVNSAFSETAPCINAKFMGSHLSTILQTIFFLSKFSSFKSFQTFVGPLTLSFYGSEYFTTLTLFIAHLSSDFKV